MDNIDKFLKKSQQEFRAKLNKLVSDQMAQLNLSDADLAAKAGVGLDVVEKIFSEEGELTTEELEKISKATQLRWG